MEISHILCSSGVPCIEQSASRNLTQSCSSVSACIFLKAEELNKKKKKEKEKKENKIQSQKSILAVYIHSNKFINIGNPRNLALNSFKKV